MNLHHAPSAAVPLQGGRWRVLAWALLFVLVAGAVQLYTSYPWDADTAYHFAVGRMIHDHGILRAFPWTPFSWLADHYADKELLFHLLFVPLAGLSYIAAAKIVGTLSGALLLLALYLVLRAEGVPLAGLWALVPLASSAYFLFRFALVRPFVLSVALALLFLWGAARGRLAVLFVVSLLYPWVYVAFWQIPCLLLAAAEGARLLSGERVQWRPAAAAAAGIVLGVAIHPNAVNLIGISWLNMTEMFFRNTLAGRGGFEMGTELQPLPPEKWGQWLLVSSAMAAASLVLAWRRRRDDVVPFAFALATLAFWLLAVPSAKFIEYFVPFSAAALALAARPLARRSILWATLGAALVYTAAWGTEAVKLLARRVDDMPPAVESQLRQQIPPGAQVFTCDWGMTGLLMLALPERRFIVALDPTFFSAKDPELYQLWYRLPREAPPGAAEIIRRRFGARYVIGTVRPEWRSFYYRLSTEPGVRTLLVTKIMMAYDLGGP